MPSIASSNSALTTVCVCISGSLVVWPPHWPGMLFPNSCGIKAAANLSLSLFMHMNLYAVEIIYSSHMWIHIDYEFIWSFHIWIHMYMNSIIYIYVYIWIHLWIILTENSCDNFIWIWNTVLDSMMGNRCFLETCKGFKYHDGFNYRFVLMWGRALKFP